MYKCTVARGKPISDSTVRSISSGRDCVSTEMVTSSGRASSSNRERTKSKSVCEAEGNPISISLYPMRTRRSNILRLRAGSMGSIRDWFPSRRSVDSHRGAWVIRLEGHCRSGRSTGFVSRNARYLTVGIPEPAGRGTFDVVFTPSVYEDPLILAL